MQTLEMLNASLRMKLMQSTGKFLCKNGSAVLIYSFSSKYLDMIQVPLKPKRPNSKTAKTDCSNLSSATNFAVSCSQPRKQTTIKTQPKTPSNYPLLSLL